MATIDLDTSEEAEPKSALWKSFEDVVAVVAEALPELRRPICQDDHFTIVRKFSEKISPLGSSHEWASAIPIEFTPTLAMLCDDCRRFLLFSEANLVRLSESEK